MITESGEKGPIAGDALLRTSRRAADATHRIPQTKIDRHQDYRCKGAAGLSAGGRLVGKNDCGQTAGVAEQLIPIDPATIKIDADPAVKRNSRGDASDDVGLEGCA